MAEVRETGGGRTLFWRANVVNCVIDDELKVLLQQGVDQRGVRNTLSVCRNTHKKMFSLPFSCFFVFFSSGSVKAVKRWQMRPTDHNEDNMQQQKSLIF